MHSILSQYCCVYKFNRCVQLKPFTALINALPSRQYSMYSRSGQTFQLMVTLGYGNCREGCNIFTIMLIPAQQTQYFAFHSWTTVDFCFTFLNWSKKISFPFLFFYLQPVFVLYSHYIWHASMPLSMCTRTYNSAASGSEDATFRWAAPPLVCSVQKILRATLAIRSVLASRHKFTHL